MWLNYLAPATLPHGEQIFSAHGMLIRYSREETLFRKEQQRCMIATNVLIVY